MDKRYRHELKYQITYADYLALKNRVSHFMSKDSHTKEDGKYLIRSVYFDTFDDKAIKEKISGVPRREKFRIRYYNDDMSFIVLEKKIKHNELCLKLDAKIDEGQYMDILNGKIDWMINDQNELIKEFYFKLRSCTLRPKVMVSYIREPYVYRPGNVRVTFDSCITTSLFKRDFKNDDLEVAIDDTMILEVKYDAYMPDVIKDLLQLEDIRQMAYSKYTVCRRFG